MKAAVSLPLPLDPVDDTYLRLAPPPGPAPRRLPRIEWTRRFGPVLHPSPLGRNVLGLKLTANGAARSTDEALRAFAETPERLDGELTGRRDPPRAVVVGTTTDPFPPLAELQAETARVVEVLARHGVEAWLMTRGFIRPWVQEVLAAHREFVKVTFGLTTLDRRLQRVLEPWTASPRLRLRQLARLRRLGIATHVALDPLIPGLTDTRDNLAAVVQTLAETGVRHVTASYLFLRPGIADRMARDLEPLGWDQMVLDAYTGGPVLAGPGLPPARYLPKPRRQRGFAALMALAAEYGIRVSVCGTSNPDFATPRPAAVPRQPLLQQFLAATRQLHFA